MAQAVKRPDYQDARQQILQELHRISANPNSTLAECEQIYKKVHNVVYETAPEYSGREFPKIWNAALVIARLLIFDKVKESVDEKVKKYIEEKGLSPSSPRTRSDSCPNQTTKSE